MYPCIKIHEGFLGGVVLRFWAFAAVAWVQSLVGETEILQALQHSQKKKREREKINNR